MPLDAGVAQLHAQDPPELIGDHARQPVGLGVQDPQGIGGGDASRAPCQRGSDAAPVEGEVDGAVVPGQHPQRRRTLRVEVAAPDQAPALLAHADDLARRDARVGVAEVARVPEGVAPRNAAHGGGLEGDAGAGGGPGRGGTHPGSVAVRPTGRRTPWAPRSGPTRSEPAEKLNPAQAAPKMFIYYY